MLSTINGAWRACARRFPLAAHKRISGENGALAKALMKSTASD
jgi:hypothetical protein